MLESSDTLLVLGWHNVRPTWFFPKRRALSTAGFTMQMQTLARLAHVVPLEEGLERLSVGEPLPPRAVALTFDDGYSDALSAVAPVLRRLGLPATFFLCPGIVDRTVEPWWEVVGWAVNSPTRLSVRFRGNYLPLRDPQERHWAAHRIAESLKNTTQQHRTEAIASLVELCRPTRCVDVDNLFLDWPQATELAGLGFSIGSHTLSHCVLSQESLDVQRGEIAGARQRLAQQVGIAPVSFAYPNGRAIDLTQQTIDLLQQAGHRFSLTTIGGVNSPATPPHMLRRVMIEPQHGPASLIGLLHPQRTQPPIQVPVH